MNQAYSQAVSHGVSLVHSVLCFLTILLTWACNKTKTKHDSIFVCREATLTAPRRARGSSGTPTGTCWKGRSGKNTRLSINIEQNINILNLFLSLWKAASTAALSSGTRTATGERERSCAGFFKRPLLLNLIFHGRLTVALHFFAAFFRERSCSTSPPPGGR